MFSELPTRPDNAVIARKLAAMRGLGDYPADLPYRVLSTKGGAGQQGGAIDGGWGPVTAPVESGEDCDTELCWLKKISRQLEHLPERLALTWRTRFVVCPREAVSFIALSGTVSVPAGTAVAVVNQVVQPRFSGFVTRVGISVLAPASFPDVTWQLRINGAVHPEFANRIFSAGNLNTPDDFVFELIQGRTVQLVAINTSGLAIDVQGKLVGWTEFLTDDKTYGGSPSSGIA